MTTVPVFLRENLAGKPMGNIALGFTEMAIDATQRAFRILLRLAAAGGLAAVSGIVIGALATAGGLAQLAVTAFAAFALWVPFFLILSSLSRWRARRAAQPKLSRRAARVARSSGPSWHRLQQLAGARGGEVHLSRERLALVHESLPANSLDPQVHELRLLIERRVPQLIESRLASLPSKPAEREAAVDDLVDLVGRFAANSDEQRERLAHASRSEHEAVRQRIENHLAEPSL